MVTNRSWIGHKRQIKLLGYCCCYLRCEGNKFINQEGVTWAFEIIESHKRAYSYSHRESSDFIVNCSESFFFDQERKSNYMVSIHVNYKVTLC